MNDSFNYTVFKQTFLEGVRADGAEYVLQHGCNGQSHVNLLERREVRKDLKPYLAYEVDHLEVGACDNTCEGKKEQNIDSFVYEK